MVFARGLDASWMHTVLRLGCLGDGYATFHYSNSDHLSISSQRCVNIKTFLLYFVN